jgi:hypothetical protein
MRTRKTGIPLRAAIVGLIAALALAAAPAAQAACGGVKHYAPSTAKRSPAPLAIGDSVMMGAVEPLRRAGFEIDVRGCRQMSEGLQVMSARKRSGSLPPVVVVALGNNWTVSTAEIRRAMRIVGSERLLGLVTPRGAMASARTAIRAAGRRWPTRVRVLDWATRSAGKSWTWDDLHLTSEGARGFTRLLEQAMSWPLPGDKAVVEKPPARSGSGGGVVAPP